MLSFIAGGQHTFELRAFAYSESKLGTHAWVHCTSTARIDNPGNDEGGERLARVYFVASLDTRPPFAFVGPTARG